MLKRRTIYPELQNTRPEILIKLKILAAAAGMTTSKFVSLLVEKEWEEKQDTVVTVSQKIINKAAELIIKGLVQK